MTPDEHQMLVLLFSNQRKLIATIWEVMKSRGLISPDDIPAFEFATSQEDLGMAEHFRRAIADYWEAAHACSVPLPPDIEAIGKTAKEWNPGNRD